MKIHKIVGIFTPGGLDQTPWLINYLTYNSMKLLDACFSVSLEVLSSVN